MNNNLFNRLMNDLMEIEDINIRKFDIFLVHDFDNRQTNHLFIWDGYSIFSEYLNPNLDKSINITDEFIAVDITEKVIYSIKQNDINYLEHIINEELNEISLIIEDLN